MHFFMWIHWMGCVVRHDLFMLGNLSVMLVHSPCAIGSDDCWKWFLSSKWWKIWSHDDNFLIVLLPICSKHRQHMPYSIQHGYLNWLHAVLFPTDARGGYCYASLLNGRCANQNSQLLTKMQCCCDSGRCWSDGSPPEMCPIRGTGGVTLHHMALNLYVSPCLNMSHWAKLLLFFTCL